MVMSEDNESHPLLTPGFVASAVTVAVILSVGVTLAAVNLLGGDDGGTASGAAPAASDGGGAPSSTPAVASDSVCGLPNGDGTTLTSPPEDTSWEFVGTTRAPSTPYAGPGVVEDDGLRSCFARSPAGALLAAANFIAMGSDQSLIQRLTEEMVADGPGREAELARLAEEGVNPEDFDVRYEIEGFRLLRYSPDLARVDIVISTSLNAPFAVVHDMTWQDGDWKVMFNDDGNPKFPVTQLPNTSGYILWGAV